MVDLRDRQGEGCRRHRAAVTTKRKKRRKDRDDDDNIKPTKTVTKPNHQQQHST